MRAPEFWTARAGAGALLAPLGAAYALGVRLRRRWARSVRVPVPVVCVGNLVVGGAGKTPVALAVGAALRGFGHRVVFLTRGYGGRLAGPVLVDAARHQAEDVGDEPLLLARRAPTMVARDRVAGAVAAVAAGAEILVLDDGFQNPSLAKDMALLVVDGGYGLGNGRVLPAGPLREPAAEGIARADAVVVLGEDRVGAAALAAGRPLLHARLVPDLDGLALAGQRVLAFAGIARPAKFFETVAALGCTLVATHAFADHHAYTPDEIMRLVEAAAAAGAVPLTTEKDHVRLSVAARPMVQMLRVAVEWREPERIQALLRPLLAATRAA